MPRNLALQSKDTLHIRVETQRFKEYIVNERITINYFAEEIFVLEYMV